MEKLFDILLKIGSITGLFAFLYILSENLRKKPKFKFDFQSSFGDLINENGTNFFTYTFTGHVKNQSLNQNSITKIFLVVWKNKKRNSVLRFGHGGITIVHESSEIKLPILFSPTEAKELTIIFKFVAHGTQDEHLMSARIPLPNDPELSLPKYEYELCFEDVHENLFDQKGEMRNRIEIDLRWTTDNPWIIFKEEKRIYPLVQHYIKLYTSVISFRIYKVMNKIGIWR